MFVKTEVVSTPMTDKKSSVIPTASGAAGLGFMRHHQPVTSSTSAGSGVGTAPPVLQFPPCTVSIAMTINRDTAARIEQGYKLPSSSSTAAASPFATNLKFAKGTVQGSWGRPTRKITWSRQVPFGSYVRIQLIPLEGSGCDAPPDSWPAPSGGLAPNSLTKFEVNGKDMTRVIATSAKEGGGLGPEKCVVKAACMTPPRQDDGDQEHDPACCDWVDKGDYRVVSWADGTASDLPVYTEIILGPIGEAALLASS